MTQPAIADRLHSVAIHLLRWARVEDAGTFLSAARLSVLSVLVFAGSRSVTELAAAEQVAVPTMTRLLQGLEAEGWVTRRRDRTDARVVRVSATARGRRVLEAGRRARIRRVEAVLDLLDSTELARVEAATSALEGALRRLRPPQ